MKPGWPKGKRIAIAISVMVELWSDGASPQYGPNTSSLKAGTVDHSRIAWASYGAREGAWRLMRILDHHSVPATFSPSGRVFELYPELIRAIHGSGHTLAAHSYTQDTILSQLSPEQERAVIQRCVSLYENVTGARPQGWSSPVVSYTPHTAELLAEHGFKWHVDLYDTDLPRIIRTGKGDIVGIPNSDFSDNRVLKSNPLDLFDAYKGTFDYLYRHEPGSLISLAFHGHTGGRPVIAAMLDKVIAYYRDHPDVWFVRHGELAQWAVDNGMREDRSYGEMEHAARNAARG